MNKNDILKIAKSLYLQEIISRQLFAKFDPNKQLDFLDGSFARLSQRVQSIFYGFIGSRQDPRKKFPQIVEKNGMKFKIHKINLDNSVSNQIYNNAQYNIHQVAFILRKLYVTVQKGGDLSFKESIKNIEELWSTPPANNTTENRIQTIVDKLQQIKQVFITVSDFIVGDIDYITTIRQLQDGVLSLKDKQSLGAQTQQYNIIDNKMWDFIIRFKQFVNNKMSYIEVINMAVNRLKSFVQIYDQIKAQMVNVQNDEQQVQKYEIFKDILNAMQNCNSNKEISQELNKINVKNLLDKSYDNLTKDDDDIQDFIRFVKNIDANRIQANKLLNGIWYYQGLDDSVLSQEAKKCLDNLEAYAENILKDKKNKTNIVDGKSMDQKLKNEIKKCYKQLV